MSKSVEHWSGIVQVRSIISQNPLAYGGCIFGGYHVNQEGKQLSDEYLVVEASSKVLYRGNSVSQWEHWRVSGSAESKVTVGVGYARKDRHVKATELYMVRQTGDTIVKYLSESDKFRGSGIGSAKARQLYSRFGDALYGILEDGDIAKLSKVITVESATKLVNIWRENACGRFCSFLQNYRLPLKMVARVIDYYKHEAEAKIVDNPYRLLVFGAKWAEVDAIAQKTFGFAPDDPRRLTGAIDAVLTRQFTTFKHTAVPAQVLRSLLPSLLDSPSYQGARGLVDKALSSGARNGAFVVSQGGSFYHGLGPRLMERLVADRISSMIREPEHAPSLMMSNLSDDYIYSLINSYEDMERNEQNNAAFCLNEEQRNAIRTSVSNRFSLITGGAGTGKTTTLKCLYSVLGSLGYSTIGLALAGKAVKRLREVTGSVETYTIASFVGRPKELLAKSGVLVYVIIDEASMLDLQTTFKIFRCLPPSARVVLVGDQFQLPPIGPGLIFQQMVGLQAVPQTQLEIVKRQNYDTGIPLFACDIRNQCWVIPNYPGVKFIACQDRDIKDKILELLSEDFANTQILCATKHNRAGVEQINTACQKRFNSSGRPIRLIGPNGNLFNTQFKAGDRIIFLKNNYERDTMNGTVGQIKEAYYQDVTADEEDPIGKALVDDMLVDIYLDDLNSDDIGIALAYAITVHKAQGSQWQRIIVPIGMGQGLRMIDAMWLYTAVTRAEHEVILVGDEETFETAVTAPPRSNERRVEFGSLLEDMLLESRSCT